MNTDIAITLVKARDALRWISEAKDIVDLKSSMNLVDICGT